MACTNVGGRLPKTRRAAMQHSCPSGQVLDTAGSVGQLASSPVTKKLASTKTRALQVAMVGIGVS